MKVLKFGGTSVGSAERIKNVATLVRQAQAPVLVVLSAMSGTTNDLVKIGEQLYAFRQVDALTHIDVLEGKYRAVIQQLYSHEATKEKVHGIFNEYFASLRGLANDLFNNRKEKMLLAYGEMLSTTLMYHHLQEENIAAYSLKALDFMRIDANEEPDLTYISSNLNHLLANCPIPNCSIFLTEGYICRNAYGEIDNLKRGGSDYTASLVGAAVDAEEIQIWTDIDGMHNNDPRIVEKTRPVAELSFDEAAELAYFGAKILHPSTINPAKLKNIPVKLLNTMQSQMRGTTIAQHSAGDDIKAVAAKDNITAIRIQSSRMLLAYGFLTKVFEVFEKYKTPIDVITTSEISVSLTIDNDTHLAHILHDLSEFSTTQVDNYQSIVCIVGDRIATKTAYLSNIFGALTDIPIRMVSFGGSKNNISLVVDAVHKNQVLKALNYSLFQL